MIHRMYDGMGEVDSNYEKGLKETKDATVFEINRIEGIVESAFQQGFYYGQKSVIDNAKKIVDATTTVNEANTKERLF